MLLTVMILAFLVPLFVVYWLAVRRILVGAETFDEVLDHKLGLSVSFAGLLAVMMAGVTVLDFIERQPSFRQLF